MVGMQGLHDNLPGQMLAYAVQQREGVCAAAQCHKNSPDTLPGQHAQGRDLNSQINLDTLPNTMFYIILVSKTHSI
jgi:hypothetical protein